MPCELPTDPASLSVQEVLAKLEVQPSHGLSTSDAAARLEQFGPNALPETPPTPWWKLVLEQFDDGFVKILLAAATVSFCMAVAERDLSGFVEPIVILTILVLNAAVGVWQENRAENAIEALKLFVPKQAVVLRDKGTRATVLAESLVPGDIVEISVGNRIPADMRVLELQSTTLRVDQAILNGESVESMKHTEVVPASSSRDRFPANMVYSGTAVVYGKATCVVVRTGASTEIGSIERGVREQEEVKTPLQQKLDEFGELLSKVIGYICLAVFVLNLARWHLTHPYTTSSSEEGDGSSASAWWEFYIAPTVHSLKVAVALAVAAIPEGLPAVVTTCLALGTRKMAQHNAYVRDLPSVETLGRCTVICSDKTGTLTTNMMSVVEVVTLGTPKANMTGAKAVELRRLTLTDSQFTPVRGAVFDRHGAAVADAATHDTCVHMLSTIAVLCNDASLTIRAPTNNNNNNAVVVEKVGEATEAALLTMAEKLNTATTSESSTESAAVPIDGFRKATEAVWHKNTTLEFTRKRKTMGVHCTSTTTNTSGGSTSSPTSSPSKAKRSAAKATHQLFVKGAPENVLARSTRVMIGSGHGNDAAFIPLTASLRRTILAEIDRMSSSESALRCIGFAYAPSNPLDELNLTDPDHFETVESNLTFVGVCGMLDPPRMEVRDSIEQCHTAGIRVMVITGDRKETAEAVCRKIGVLTPDDVLSEVSFTGAELDAMSDADKRDMILRAKLFSRTDPTHKLELVRLLQEQKKICAMTGDGVNDAPALKKADIGIAMGGGTEVAKAASKMVLADDNFATVVKAVAEGRAIYNNTKQFIRYLISSNIGEVVCILTTGLLGVPEALEPVQLLWVNLVTDGLPATALGFNAPDPDIMQRPPRGADEPIVNGWLFLRYLIVGAYVGLATVGGFLWWFLSNGFTWNDLLTHHLCTNLLDAKCQIIADPATARCVALSILVIVEMFNALNALSESQSIVQMRPSSNKPLLLAIASSVLLHLMILYVPAFARTFGVVPLGVPITEFEAAAPWTVLIPSDFSDWKAVMVFSIPVLFVDELLKFVSVRFHQY